MKKDAWIHIKGTQTVDGEDDITELYTQGNYYKKNGCYYITYDETETTGFSGGKTILKVVGEEKVSLVRHGASKSSLLVERDHRNIGYYGTSEGDLVIGVMAKRICSELTDQGGRLTFEYSLDVNSSHLSDNKVTITINPQDEKE